MHIPGMKRRACNEHGPASGTHLVLPKTTAQTLAQIFIYCSKVHKMLLINLPIFWLHNGTLESCCLKGLLLVTKVKVRFMH